MKNLIALFCLLLPGLVLGQEITRSNPSPPVNASNITGTLPDALLSNNVVTLNGAQNLVNKTLTSPTLVSPVWSGTAVGDLYLAGNLSINSGSGTNTLTLRDVIISKTVGTGLTLGSGILVTGRNSVFGSTNNSGIVGFARGGDGATSAQIGYTTSGTEGSKFTINSFGGSPSIALSTGNTERLTIDGSGNITSLGTLLVPNRLAAFGTTGAAGLISFARSSDGLLLGTLGYSGPTENSKITLNSHGGGGSLSLGTGGVADRLTIGSAGDVNIATRTTYLGSLNNGGQLIFNRGSDANRGGYVGMNDATTSNDVVLASQSGGGTLGFLVNNSAVTRVGHFFADGNFALQNGGTFTNNGARFQLDGRSTQTGIVTPTSGTAIGNANSQTLTATANNDILIGQFVNPTFNVGAFTGVTRVPYGVRTVSSGGGAGEAIRVYRSDIDTQYMSISETDGAAHEISGNNNKIFRFKNVGGVSTDFEWHTGGTPGTRKLLLTGAGSLIVGTQADDGSGRLLQVGGDVGATGAMISSVAYHNFLRTVSGTTMSFQSNTGTNWASLSASGLDVSLGSINTPASDASGNGTYKINGQRVLGIYGTGNTWIGAAAGNLTLTGTQNQAIGPSALQGVTTGNQNVVFGTSAGQYITSGSGNVFIGHGAGFQTGVTNSSSNVWIGQNAGRNSTGTAYGNTIYIGADAGKGIPSESNTFRVGDPTIPVSGTMTGNWTVAGTTGSPVLALTDGVTVTWDSNTGNEKILTLGGTGRTLTITNALPGAFYTLKIIQDATGSRTITTYPTNTKWPSGVVPTLTATAGAVDILTLFYDGTNYNAILTNDFR